MARLWFALCLALLSGFLALAASPLTARAPLEAPPADAGSVPAATHREPLAAPPVLSPELAALVERLGDDSFVRREAASAKLADLGLPAKPALQAALKHADPEVRLRARRLLGQIQAADLEARLKAFVADTDGRQEHDLPGWSRYRKLVGEDRTARKLFADMHRAESGLMETSAGGGDAAAEALQMRAYDLLRGMQTGSISGRTGGTSLGGVAAMLFVAGDERAKVNDTTQVQVYNFIQQQPFQQALRDGTDGPAAKRLLGSWISRQTGATTAQIGIQLAAQWDLKQGAVPARKVATDKSASPYSRAYALSALAKLGDKEDLPVLQDLLADRSSYPRVTIVDGKRIDRNTEMRDVALAALIYMTGQKFEDYGFKGMTVATPLPFNYGQVQFPTDEAREAALKKWREWVAKNPLDVNKRAETKTDKPVQPAMRGAVVGGGFFFAGPGVVMVAGGVDKADAKPQDELPFYLTDREAGQRLARARRLIEEGQFTPALRVLDAVLAQAGDRSFQPETGRPLYLSLRLEAERLLGQLPEEGRGAYELLIGGQARRELEEAVAAGDVAGLQQVARRYLASAAGQEAALLVGEHLLDGGRPLAAAVVFSTLREHDHDRRFEPLLSLRIAHAWLWAGMPQEARAALRQMKASRDALDNLRNSLEFTGRRLPPLENVEAVLAVLSDVTPMQFAAVPQSGDWALFRGDARRNAAADGQAPWLRSRWRAETAKTQAVRDAIASLATAYRQERLSALPTGHPLAVGDTVLARTTGELLALDGNSGKLRWRVPLTDAVDDLMATSGQPTDANAILRGLDERVWNDLTYGTLASDGRCAYLVEDVGLVHGLSAERMVVRPDGSRRLDAGWPGENNRLTAYDLRTGKFRWEIGGPRGDFQLDLAGAYFLGPPLPLAGKLYAMAEADGRICLLALDPLDGKPIERFPLAVLDQPDATGRQFGGYMPMPPGRPTRRLSGASPAYAGGVMVCPTSWNSFTAVDIGSGSILWSYRPMRLEDNARPNGNLLMFGLPQSPGAVDDALRRDDRWADCSVTIAGDRVLVTPRESDRLLCLDLRSGRLLWEAPRWDAQYVAAAADGVALLVGRASLRGLKMSDGKPAWEALPLPAGAAPSGRGYLSEGRYYLPLASAEVAVVDPAAGRLLHRAKSPDGRVPGNLVCAKNQVISQGAEGIESFPRLDGAIGLAALAVGRQPNDPTALAEYGRMLLARGDYAEAISQLRRALELRKDDATRASLCDAVLQALEADFPAHRQTAVELAAIFREADQETAYLRAKAVGLRRAGEHLDAFEALVELAGHANSSRVLQPASAALYTTRDVWLRGQLADLRAACTPAEQADMDRRIVDRLAKAIESKDTQTLRQWQDVFGDHPRAAAVRDVLLARYLDLATGKLLDSSVRPLDVERLLVEAQAGPDAERSRAATAGLARMMAASGRAEEAAVLYRRLGGDLADAVCLAGKTGRQLFDELPADAPVRRVLNATGAWPQGLVAKQTIPSTATRVVPTTWPLNVEAARNSLFDELRLEATASVSPQKIIARDSTGTERWSVELKPPDGGNFNFSPQTLRTKLDGHLLLVWQGNRVFAIDALAAEGKRPAVLWSKDLTTKFPGLDSGPGYAQQRVILAGGGMVFASTDAFGRPMAEIGPLTGRLLCYQGLRALTAVDPMTGDVRWSRHDVPRGCELLGDEEVVLALPRDGTTAQVLRATDGQALGRCEVPDKRDRLAVLGRQVVTWTGGDERQTLRLLDPWKRRNVWSREFPAGSKLARIGANEAGVVEAGVLDPQGNFSVLSLADGASRVSTRLKPPANLLEIHVLRSPDRYLLLAKQSLVAPAAAAGKPAEKIVYPLSLGGQTEIVSGTLYGFDRAKGALKWEAAIDQRGLDFGQSLHWPILVLAERLYYQGENGPRRYETKVTCLDKRDGRTVFEETSPLTGGQLQVLPDAASHAVEVRTSSATTKLVFTGKPWPAK